jgi:hypothetical protein
MYHTIIEFPYRSPKVTYGWLQVLASTLLKIVKQAGATFGFFLYSTSSTNATAYEQNNGLVAGYQDIRLRHKQSMF